MSGFQFVDLMQPFQLHPEGADGPTMHGRMTRLGPVADDILSRHDYPAPVAELLGEALALTASLAGGLKFDGVFTLQIQAEGPVSLLVVDATSGGDLRGYAGFDAAALPGTDEIAAAPVPALLGGGHFAFTVDMGPDRDRYQGVVAIEGANLTDCAHHYFRRSEQMNTAIQLAAARTAGCWWAGSLLLQQLPEAEGQPPASDDGDDPWRRAMMLLATGTDDELLDGDLGADTYLHRLFHQEGLALPASRAWRRGCQCSEIRMRNALKSLPQDDLHELVIGDRIEVTCEFCNETRAFDPDNLEIMELARN